MSVVDVSKTAQTKKNVFVIPRWARNYLSLYINVSKIFESPHYALQCKNAKTLTSRQTPFWWLNTRYPFQKFRRIFTTTGLNISVVNVACCSLLSVLFRRKEKKTLQYFFRYISNTSVRILKLQTAASKKSFHHLLFRKTTCYLLWENNPLFLLQKKALLKPKLGECMCEKLIGCF